MFQFPKDQRSTENCYFVLNELRLIRTLNLNWDIDSCNTLINTFWEISDKHRAALLLYTLYSDSYIKSAEVFWANE